MSNARSNNWVGLPQVSIRKAIPRDEIAIRDWRHRIWLELPRQASRERQVLVLVDESGFSLPPGLASTCAPKGLTPVLRERVTWDHLSVMGGMTPAGKVSMLVSHEWLNGSHSLDLLINVRRVAGDRMLVIRECFLIFRRSVVREFVSGARRKNRVEALSVMRPI